MYIGPDNADKLVAGVKQEAQVQPKSKSLMNLCKIYATSIINRVYR